MTAALTPSDLDAITAVLKALAHDLRIKLMHTLLERGETSVSELERLTGIAQPGLSQQLAILRKAQLVHTRRHAKLIFYRIAPESIAQTAGLLAAFFANGEPAVETGEIKPPHRKTGSAATFARML